jgi:PAS domain S-box-containing protein
VTSMLEQLSHTDPMKENAKLRSRIYKLERIIRALTKAENTSDISFIEKAENILKQSEEKYRKLVDNSIVGVFKLTLEGEMLFANNALIRMLEYASVDAFLNESVTVLFTISGTGEKLLSIIKEQNEVSNFRTEVNTKNGNTIHVSINAQLEDNEISGVVIDITEKVKTEQKLADQNEILRIINDELVKAKEKAEESDKLKSSFLANMSHEIRTPMNAILGFANLLKTKNYTEENKRTYIEIINSKSRQLLQIITDIIDISKIEAGQISIFNKYFQINPMLNELFLSFENIRKQDNKPLRIKFRPGLPDNDDYIFSDKVRIEQILTNYLSNAYKFTDTGTIELGYKVKENELLFYVEDTGIGLTPEDQKIIFDRFSQVDSSHSRSYGGTGLGLAISKGLAERMNGQIYVESQVGKGSVFYLKIPFIKGKSLAPVEKVFDESAYDWSNKTILIAEDEVDNFTFFESLFKATRATILWAKNGVEAVELCRLNTAIDVVLMDVKMPSMDGLEATRQIKRIRNTLPVIVQTAYALSADEENCMKAGCDAYISKPIKIEFLFQLMQKYI